MRFWKNVSQEVWRVNMAINDKIREGEFQYGINMAAAKISVLSSCNIDKDEYLTDKEILPHATAYYNRRREIYIFPT